MGRVILATSSVYRRMAFGKLGIDYICIKPNFDESSLSRELFPRALVLQLSELKVKSVLDKVPDNFNAVLGFDTVGYSNHKILEKPKSRNEAFERLKCLSGEKFGFYTGVYAFNKKNGKAAKEVNVTSAKMRKITDNEINKYLDADERFNTFALGFNTMDFSSSAFIESIRGSYNNLLYGLPLEVIPRMLEKVGFEI